VSAVKTIVLLSGTFFIVYMPILIFRLVLYGTVSTADLETRRYPALSLIVRCLFLAMMTTIPIVNPILYLNNRKNIRASMFALLPWLRRAGTLRSTRIDVVAMATSVSPS
jgi:hypothetical protein